MSRIKIVFVYSVQFENGYVFKYFGNYSKALDFCRHFYPDSEVKEFPFVESESLKNFY